MIWGEDCVDLHFNDSVFQNFGTIYEMETAPQRHHYYSIDILKFLAVLLVINSHLDNFYPSARLATGGAIGDVLFFFCSGFTLSLGRTQKFIPYYKRRIFRIYPSIIAWAILRTLFFDYRGNIVDIILFGGGWFIACIMIYYVMFYVIQKHFPHHLLQVFGIYSLIVLIWYLFFFEHKEFVWMYKGTYFKWCHYFLFMLLGAICAKMSQQNTVHFTNKVGTYAIGLLVALITYYAILILGEKHPTIAQAQVISLIPLLGITYTIYALASSDIAKRVYDNKYLHRPIMIVGGLCLEFYIIQGIILSIVPQFTFPFNVLFLLITLCLMAYIVRCLGRFIQQTLQDRLDYDWKEIIEI